jgi:hypothetical protein
MSTKTHYKDTSTAVRASMAHFNAVLKANFFFGTYTQPENFMSLKLRRINSFIMRTIIFPASLQIIVK